MNESMLVVISQSCRLVSAESKEPGRESMSNPAFRRSLKSRGPEPRYLPPPGLVNGDLALCLPSHEAAGMEGGSDLAEDAQRRGSPEVLLSGVFCLVPALKINYDLSLTRGAELQMRRLDSAPESSFTALSLSDCIGCYAFQSKDAPQPEAAYFTVFCYPFKKSWWDSGESRQRVAKTFRVLVSREAEANRTIAETWARKIRDLSIPRSLKLEGECLLRWEDSGMQTELAPPAPCTLRTHGGAEFLICKIGKGCSKSGQRGDLPYFSRCKRFL